MAGHNLKVFNDENFKSEVLDSPIPVIVDFWAEWCGPCKMLTPILDELAPQYEGKLKIGKLNVDDNPATASRYGINSIPTMLFVKNGEIADQQVGLLAKNPLKTKIDSFLKA